MRGLDPRIHLLRKMFLRRWMDCRVKPGNDSEGVVPAKTGTHDHRRWGSRLSLRSAGTTIVRSERSTNLQVYEITAGAISLLWDCYLQWLAQLQRVGAAEAYLSPHMSPTMCHHPSS
jgi:hypothetical protein